LSGPIRYLALGDSYTIGTGASSEAHNFPSILRDLLAKATRRPVELTNPAVNGFTTDDLIAKELDHLDRVRPDIISVLIGVNDLVQHVSAEEYRTSLTLIYDRIGRLQLPRGRVVGISIPNWSMVPAAAEFGGPQLIKAMTNDYNAVAREEALSRSFGWVDITGVSTYQMGSPGWIAADGLHPGDPQYRAWAEVIWERVRDSWSAVA
jgi:acyl-CoA thioesterase-1